VDQRNAAPVPPIRGGPAGEIGYSTWLAGCQKAGSGKITKLLKSGGYFYMRVLFQK
jgi:hypothetical protein